MTSERIYNFCYSLFKVFVWGILFVFLEMMLWYSSWMLFGSIANLLIWTWPSVFEDNSQQFQRDFSMVGRVISLIVGVVLMRFLTGGKAKPVVF